MENLVAMNNDFWAGKRVLITGHTGFKGCWLSLRIQTSGSRVAGYALPPPPGPSIFAAANVGDGMESVIGDVRDMEHLRQVVRSFQPEVIFHLAAQSLVRRSYSDPVGTYATNVMGTVHLLEAAREGDSVRVIVNVTSDKCYENRQKIEGYKETDAMGGYDPYSSSKGCSEMVTAAYRRSFFSDDRQIAVASVRAGNVIGGGDWAEDRLVPDVIRAFANGDRPAIRRPDAIRPWQHVADPILGYMLLAERMWFDPALFSEAWNFGPDEKDTWSVAQVVERLTALWGADAAWRLDPGTHPHEAKSLTLDCAKARSRLSWRPVWPLDRALSSTVDWYKAYYRRDDVRLLTIRQIEEHAAIARSSSKTSLQ